jgi:hypothetical protein
MAFFFWKMFIQSTHSSNKKRNFSKESIALLNDYYFAHMDKPYPSDDVKLALAAQTGPTSLSISRRLILEKQTNIHVLSQG